MPTDMGIFAALPSKPSSSSLFPMLRSARIDCLVHVFNATSLMFSHAREASLWAGELANLLQKKDSSQSRLSGGEKMEEGGREAGERERQRETERDKERERQRDIEKEWRNVGAGAGPFGINDKPSLR